MLAGMNGDVRRDGRAVPRAGRGDPAGGGHALPRCVGVCCDRSGTATGTQFRHSRARRPVDRSGMATGPRFRHRRARRPVLFAVIRDAAAPAARAHRRSGRDALTTTVMTLSARRGRSLTWDQGKEMSERRNSPHHRRPCVFFLRSVRPWCWPGRPGWKGRLAARVLAELGGAGWSAETRCGARHRRVTPRTERWPTCCQR